MMLSMSGMYTMYIIQAGFSKAEISITVSIFTFSSLIGQYIIGYITDRFKCVKKILFISIFISLIGTTALIFLKEGWTINILVLLWGFFAYGTVPISEAWYIDVLKANGDQKIFGRIRGFGSIGFGISGMLLGFLLQSFGWSIYKWYIITSVFLVLLLILTMEDNKELKLYKGIGGGKGDEANISLKEAFREIIKNKPLKSIIIVLFTFTFVVKGIYSYLGVIVSDSGGGSLSYGLTLFFDASPEIITFFLASKLLARYRNKGLIFAAFILQIIRLSLILVFNSPTAIMLLGILSGFSFGLLASSYKTYIYDLAPEKYKISCLGLSESIIGFSAVLSVPIFGFIVMKFGGYASIAVGLAINIIAAFILARSLRTKEHFTCRN